MLKMMPREDDERYKEELEIIRKALREDFDERRSKIHPYKTRVLVKDIEKEANVVGYEDTGGILNYFVQFDEVLEECYKYSYDTIKVSHSAITPIR